MTKTKYVKTLADFIPSTVGLQNSAEAVARSATKNEVHYGTRRFFFLVCVVTVCSPPRFQNQATAGGRGGGREGERQSSFGSRNAPQISSLYETLFRETVPSLH